MGSLALREQLDLAAFELILVRAPRWMVTAVYEAAYRLDHPQVERLLSTLNLGGVDVPAPRKLT